MASEKETSMDDEASQEDEQRCEGRAFCEGDELALVNDYSGRGPEPRKRLLCGACRKAMRAAEAEECRGDYLRDMAKDRAVSP
jgi:hypothetical protein